MRIFHINPDYFVNLKHSKQQSSLLKLPSAKGSTYERRIQGGIIEGFTLVKPSDQAIKTHAQYIGAQVNVRESVFYHRFDKHAQTHENGNDA